MQFGTLCFVETPVTFKISADYGDFYLTGVIDELDLLEKYFSPWPVIVHNEFSHTINKGNV